MDKIPESHSEIIACSGCGQVHDEATRLLFEHKQVLDHVEELQSKLDFYHHELWVKGCKITRLQKNADEKARASKHYNDAMEVLEFWRDHCHRNAKELEGERLKKVIERLSGKPKPYTKDELMIAVRGYSYYPFLINGQRSTHGRPAQRYVDAELVFRDPQHVDQGIALAKQHEDYQEVFVGSPDSSGSGGAQMALGGSVSPSNGKNGHTPTLSLSPLGLAAVRYAEKGWLVFPCRPNQKRPASINGLLDATADEDRISRWWSKHPDCNVAVRTGRESGIVVLDVDREDGLDGLTSLRDLENEYDQLPETASIVTPRGGQHFYFAHPNVDIKNTQSVPAYGLDIRGEGGYVLAPPSLVDDRGYVVDANVGIVQMPSWLITLLIQYQKKMTSVDPKVWEDMVTVGVKKGARNGQLTRLCGMLLNKHDSGFVLGLMLTVNHERCDPPLEKQEVKRIVDSLLRKIERDKLKNVPT